MKFGRIPLDDAEGALLAHATHVAGRRLKKGHLLTAENIEDLREAGYDDIIAAKLDADDVPEDEAAAIVAQAIAGDHLEVGKSFTGRCNLIAKEHGVIAIDRERLDQLNLVDEAVTVATVAPYDIVSPGQLVATIKIIPFSVSRPLLDTAVAVGASGGPFINVAPFTAKKVALIQTRLPGMKESILDKTTDVTAQRLESLGSTISLEDRCDHKRDDVVRSLKKAQQAGCDLFLIFGASATVDREDVVPGGVVEAGGEVEHFGMPVDPGNLLFIGKLDGVPVIGMPGCARSPKINGFDWVLWRVLADVTVSGEDIMKMGAGGLLKEIAERGQRREETNTSGKTGTTSAPNIGVVVLAAGASRRMGAQNKLLAEVNGKPMVVNVVDTVTGAVKGPTIVVTGHEPEKVEKALAAHDVTFVHNPDYAMGLSTSLRTGIRALPDDVDAVLVCLGDMPLVTADHIARLIQAFDPVEGRSICLPVHGRKRGNPVLWAKKFLPEMARVTGDVGARQLLEEHGDEICEVEIDDDGVLFDVDTPERLAHLAERANSAA